MYYFIYLSTWRLKEESMGLYCLHNFMRLKTLRPWDLLPKCIIKIFFSKRLSCHSTAMLWDSCAEGQDYGLISLLVLQFCPSQFSPWFQSDPAASRYTPVGLVWQWALAIFYIAGREKNLQWVSLAVHEAVGMAVPPSWKSLHTMIDLGHWKVPRAKYRWSLLFLFAYRWTRSWAALRRPGSQLIPRNDCAIFCSFPSHYFSGLEGI